MLGAKIQDIIIAGFIAIVTRNNLRHRDIILITHSLLSEFTLALLVY
jgi:hypothetical protein